jgi:hypothetical protein
MEQSPSREPNIYSASQEIPFLLSLCFNWAPRYEGLLGEWRYSSTHSLTSALDGGEWSASHPGRFTQSHFGRGGEETNSSSRRESNPRIPFVHPLAQRYLWNPKFHKNPPLDTILSQMVKNPSKSEVLCNIS